MAYVSVGYSGISPDDAEKLLVKPLEKKLRSVAGLDKMTSVGTEGYASVTLEFLTGENIDLVLDDVRKAVDEVKSELPPKSDEPQIYEISLSMFPIVTAAIYGDIPVKTLITAARELKDRLESVEGVLEVEIGGDREEIVEVLSNEDIEDNELGSFLKFLSPILRYNLSLNSGEKLEYSLPPLATIKSNLPSPLKSSIRQSISSERISSSKAEL